MTPEQTLVVLERIANEANLSQKEVVEEFNESIFRMSAESADSLEQRLRSFFGLPPSGHTG